MVQFTSLEKKCQKWKNSIEMNKREEIKLNGYMICFGTSDEQLVGSIQGSLLKIGRLISLLSLGFK